MARQFSRPSCLFSRGVAFAVAGTPYAHVFASVTHPYQGHDMTSCCWLVVMDSERFASPIEGIFCGGLNAYCMHIRPLFLRTSGSSGVLRALLLERNGQLSCMRCPRERLSFWPCDWPSVVRRRKRSAHRKRLRCHLRLFVPQQPGKRSTAACAGRAHGISGSQEARNTCAEEVRVCLVVRGRTV